MRVFVLQRYNHDLDQILLSTFFEYMPQSATKGEIEKIQQSVTLSTNPQEIIWLLSEISRDEKVIVICGQDFSNHDTNGLAIASRIKRIRPDALHFVYSVTPWKNEYIDGLIPKAAQVENGRYDKVGLVITSLILAGDKEEEKLIFWKEELARNLKQAKG